MSSFDPMQFMNTTVNESLSEKRLLCPEGEYTGIILADKISASKVDFTNSDGPGTFYKLQLQIELDGESNERAKAVTHRDKNIVRYEPTLDINDAGNLDLREGMNVPLGQLRAACGQNNPGQPWSPAMLGGQMVKFQLIHKMDKNGEPREQITKVGKPY